MILTRQHKDLQSNQTILTCKKSNLQFILNDFNL